MARENQDTITLWHFVVKKWKNPVFKTTLYRAIEASNEMSLNNIEVIISYLDTVMKDGHDATLFDLADDTYAHAYDQEIEVDDEGKSQITVFFEGDQSQKQSREIKFTMVTRTPLNESNLIK